MGIKIQSDDDLFTEQGHYSVSGNLFHNHVVGAGKSQVGFQLFGRDCNIGDIITKPIILLAAVEKNSSISGDHDEPVDTGQAGSRILEFL